MESKQKIDGEWFTSRLNEKDRSVRGLGRHLGLDASAVSRMFSGQRKMQLEEIGPIAAFLGVPVEEVLCHAGVPINTEGQDSGSQPACMLITARIDKTGKVERLTNPLPLQQSVMDRAQSAIQGQGGGRIIAAQICALDGPLALLDDAVLLFHHADAMAPDAFGALSICRSLKGDELLAKIERVRKTGEARVLSVSGDVKDVDLQTATPVLAVIPSKALPDPRGESLRHAGSCSRGLVHWPVSAGSA